MMLQPKYQGLVVSEKNIFYVFPVQSNVKRDPQGWPIFGNRHNLNKLGLQDDGL